MAAVAVVDAQERTHPAEGWPYEDAKPAESILSRA
jgi:hypothetical protein